ncbi:MAG: hypothetical protein PVH47_08175 [Thiohalocapsa sp.]|jgi:hypothetical protein
MTGAEPVVVRLRLALGTVVLSLGVAGCILSALPGTGPVRGDTGLRVEISAPITIPAGSAHASLQHGRVVRATSKLDPYCELEVRSVGETARRLMPGRFIVARIGERLLLDPTTRIPALAPGLPLGGLGCLDPLYQESIWYLRAGQPSELMYLRCIAPYFDCRLGPPLSPDQVQQVAGRYLSVLVGHAPMP